jgi:hypothetical protein
MTLTDQLTDQPTAYLPAYLTPWSRVLFEMLIVDEIIIKFLGFMELKGLLPYS